MKYAVAYARSTWAGQGVVEAPRPASLSELDTMPPYGATIAGNTLRDHKGRDFIGVLDEYAMEADLEEAVDGLCSACGGEPLSLFFSVYVFNNDRVVRLAAALKRRYPDIRIVAGGPFAEYLEANSDFDGVIIGDAETGIPDFLANGRRVTLAAKADPNNLLVDFSVLRIDRRYAHGVANSMRGCRYRTAAGGGCVFCSMRETKLGMRTPELVLREMAREAEVLGVEWFYDGADSFVFSKGWLREFARVRSKLASDEHSILRRLKVFAYANPSDIRDEDVPRLLYDCGVRRVFLGLESASDDVLGRISKPKASVEANHRALALLGGSGLEVRVGIVLGVGETEDTLATNYDFLRALAAYRDLRVMSVVLSPVMVVPGSTLYRDMVSNELSMGAADKAEVQLIHDQVTRGGGITKQQINRLSQIYVECSTGLTWDRLLEWKRRMDEVLVAQNVGVWMFGGY